MQRGNPGIAKAREREQKVQMLLINMYTRNYKHDYTAKF
jgi:hypothetical protein